MQPRRQGTTRAGVPASLPKPAERARVVGVQGPVVGRLSTGVCPSGEKNVQGLVSAISGNLEDVPR
eukprot:6281115-Lingulodinium_polyedra.AAC.1